jgi:hypothetical protein
MHHNKTNGSLKSSAISFTRYDKAKRTLIIGYVGGDAYRYLGVPIQVAKALEIAASKGWFVNKVIKPKFKYEMAS